MVKILFTCLILTLVWKDLNSFPCLSDDSKKKFEAYRKDIIDIKNDLSKKLVKLDSEMGTLVTDLKKRQWQKYRGHCYFYGTHRVTWFTAENRCMKMGGHLAKIDDTEENKWVYNTRPTKNQYYWIGLHDLTEGEWRWTYDQSLTKIKPWLNGYGRRGSSVNCGLMYHGTKYTWLDYSCNRELLYVCESHVCY